MGADQAPVARTYRSAVNVPLVVMAAVMASPETSKRRRAQFSVMVTSRAINTAFNSRTSVSGLKWLSTE
jgi:hypothetical protein